MLVHTRRPISPGAAGRPRSFRISRKSQGRITSKCTFAELTGHHPELATSISIEKRDLEGAPKKFTLLRKQHFAAVPCGSYHARPNLPLCLKDSACNKFEHGGEPVNGNWAPTDVFENQINGVVRKVVAVHQEFVPEPPVQSIAEGDLFFDISSEPHTIMVGIPGAIPWKWN